MLRAIKKRRVVLYTAYILALMLGCSLLAGVAAHAQSYGPLESVTPANLSTDIANIINEVGMPIGGSIVLIAVVFTAIQIVTSRFNPNQRENAFHNLVPVCIGAAILGAALFFASVFLSIGTTYLH
jgi:hypothetical protein